jgi:hypothetical protein
MVATPGFYDNAGQCARRFEVKDRAREGQAVAVRTLPRFFDQFLA